jgi:hypothetical protein
MSKRSCPDTLQEESRHLLLHGAALFIPANSTRIREKHYGLLGTQYYAEFLSTDLKKQHLPRRRLQNSDVLGNEDRVCGSLMNMVMALCRSAIRKAGR